MNNLIKVLFVLGCCSSIQVICEEPKPQDLESTWQDYSIPYGDESIAMKLPNPPDTWDADEGRRWLKCESDHVIFSAMFQENPIHCTNTRLIRKYIKESPPFEGFECMELVLLQTKNKVTVDTTWKAPKGNLIQQWDTVKERRLFTSKGVYSFFIAYSSQEDQPPCSFYFSSIKFIK